MDNSKVARFLAQPVDKQKATSYSRQKAGQNRVDDENNVDVELTSVVLCHQLFHLVSIGTKKHVHLTHVKQQPLKSK